MTRYRLLLNDALKTHLLGMRDAERRRLREKLEYLSNGIWDAGVRVKKLKGSGKVVFEARLSRGDRLLFTLGRHDGGVAIYLWGLVAHDDVASEARRIVPSNAPFLSFQELEPEERVEISLDGAPEPWFTQEDVEERAPEDHGPQRWLVLDDEEWERLLASPDAATFESFLFLTRQQGELLATPPPVLVSGTAGSGKTTLSVYYLIRGAGAGRRSLFLTYNPLLERLARRIHAGLMEKRVAPAGTPPRFAVFRDLALEIAGGVEAGFPPEREVGLREFSELFHDHPESRRQDPELVWEEIRAVIKGAKLPLDPSRTAELVRRFCASRASVIERRELAEYLAGISGVLPEVESLVSRTGGFAGLPALIAAVRSGGSAETAAAAAVLPQVAEIVGRHAGDFTRPLLSLDEYRAVGAKRAPSFRHDRAAIHAVALYYQQRLEREGRWDEIDLTRAALRRLDGSPQEAAWDLVVCDEVQDLTDVQLSLLFRLAADPRAVVLTGDPRQILNPSGFRWEEVKYRFRERGLPVPEVRRLTLNFRSSGPVVRLANALLDIKQALVGLTDTEMREEWKFGGKPPVVVEDVPEERILELLRGRGAGQAILTRGAAEAARLRARLGTELVFTIAEAKGLEFDTVFLWKFCADPSAEATWRAIASGEPPADDHASHVRHEIALLYVAVTRARGNLLVWDGQEPSLLWDIPSVSPLVFRAREGLADMWRNASTPAEWETQGDYFLDRGQLRAATECYRNAGAEGKAEMALAFLLEGEERWAEAAPLFERHGQPARAAAAYEKAGGWESALAQWETAGDKRRARLAEARVAELRGMPERAAHLWEGLGDRERAAENWRKAGAFDRLAAAALSAGDARLAAGLFEKARMPREAASAWERAGEAERAGDMYLRLGEHGEAARLFRAAGAEEKLLRCLKQLGDHRGAAALYEKRGEVERAVEAFTAFASSSEANGAALGREVPEARSPKTALRAAIRLSALGRDGEAAELFERAGRHEAAAARYRRLGNLPGLARVLEAQGRPLEAARALDAAATDPLETAASIERLLLAALETAGAAVERAADGMRAEAERLLAEGRMAGALARFRLLGDDQAAAEVYRSLGMHGEAVSWLLDSHSPGLARAYVEKLSVDEAAALWQALDRGKEG